MAPRPGMPHIVPTPAAGPIPSRPAAPVVQPAITKPLFPSAAQVGILQLLTLGVLFKTPFSIIPHCSPF